MADPDESAVQVADLQAQLDQTRSECIRPLIMDHLHRAMRAKSNTDKFHEYQALCIACLSYIEDDELKNEIVKDLERPDTNLSNDFIRNYKAEMSSGVPNYLILEHEYSKLVPRIVRVWLKVQKALVEQELIPWALTYPENMLKEAFMNELFTIIQMRKFRQSTPIHDVEKKMIGQPEPPMLPKGMKTVHQDSEDDLTKYDDREMSVGDKEEGSEAASEEPATHTEPQSEELEHQEPEEQPKSEEEPPDELTDSVAELAKRIIAEYGEPIDENTVPEEDPPEKGERIQEPQVDRYEPDYLELEKHSVPENGNELGEQDDEEVYSPEDIQKGMDVFKNILRQRRLKHA